VGHESAIARGPDTRGKSTLTRDIGSRGSEDLACKRRTREVATADPPIIKVGRIRARGRLLWVDSPERSEEPLSSSGQGVRRSWWSDRQL
jgi:hypothetical protein